ncbi:MAG: hypothetical protein N3D20_00260 [Candidatus Pacearchaeota archaeon]|nr:hypothetical protein [Candidatus Pacearchaeota archaeon]
MKKRGASNIEFILAFVLFVGFVATIFYFFNPIRNVNYMESSLNYVIGAIEKNVTSEIDEVGILIKGSSSGGNIAKVKIKDISNDKKVDARDYYGFRFDAKRNGEEVYIDLKNRGTNNNFIIFRFNEEFNEETISSGQEREYTISTKDSRKIVSEKKIKQLSERYANNYLKLKEELKIPANIDFSFSLELQDRKIEVTKDIPARAEVFAKGKLIEVLKENEVTETGYLTIRIW